MKDCYRCGWIFDDKEDFCPECGMENFSDYKLSSNSMKREPLGAWILTQGTWSIKETNPPLYTGKCADVIKNKVTGKKFNRGKYVLFKEIKDKEKPMLIESTGEYEFIYNNDPFGISKKKN